MTDQPVNLLIVDDDERMQTILKMVFVMPEFRVSKAVTGKQALELAIQHPPDLVILDLMLPDTTGLAVLEELRKWMTAPVLVLTAKDDPSITVQALDLGADDYLCKPFSTQVLQARIRALLRRSMTGNEAMPSVTIGELTVDFARRRISRNGQVIPLTRTEFGLLSLLARHPDQVLTSTMMLETIWGPESRDDLQTLRVHINNLRKKIEPAKAQPRYIVTVTGVGYCLTGDIKSDSLGAPV